MRLASEAASQASLAAAWYNFAAGAALAGRNDSRFKALIAELNQRAAATQKPHQQPNGDYNI